MTLADLLAHAAAKHHAGLEARLYVRGGLDPTYTDPDARDAYVQQLADTNPVLAAAFLAGWVNHHPDPDPPVLAWHRLIGGVTIECRRAA